MVGTGAPGLSALERLAGKECMRTYRYVLVDGNNLVFRYYLGYKDSSWDNPGVYGMLRFLVDALASFHPTADILMIWDSGWSPDRLALYPDYKASRNADSKIDRNVIRAECRFARDLAYLLPVTQALNEAFPTEGDDILYSVQQDLESVDAEGRILVITEDSDMLQLLDPQTDVYAPRRNAFYTKKTESLAIGFPASRVPLYKAILGDDTDNIPGVPGVGKKTADELVSRYATLEEIRQHADEFSAEVKRIGKKVYAVLENAHIVERNLQLVRLRRVAYDCIQCTLSMAELHPILLALGMSFLCSSFGSVVGEKTWRPS